MTGSDYSVSSSTKYKIYIKNPTGPYEGLMKIFSVEQYKYLQQQISIIKKWNEQHENFYCEGFAICKDTHEKLSVNFYFKMSSEEHQ